MRVGRDAQQTKNDQFDTFSFEAIHSDAGVRTDLYDRRPDETLLIDFFGGVSHVELVIDNPPLDPLREASADSVARVMKPSRAAAAAARGVVKMDGIEERAHGMTSIVVLLIVIQALSVALYSRRR